MGFQGAGIIISKQQMIMLAEQLSGHKMTEGEAPYIWVYREMTRRGFSFRSLDEREGAADEDSRLIIIDTSRRGIPFDVEKRAESDLYKAVFKWLRKRGIETDRVGQNYYRYD